MTVYLRQLAAHLARMGVAVDIFTRATSRQELGSIAVEPGLVVHRLAAGPLGPVGRQELPKLAGEFAAAVAGAMTQLGRNGPPFQLVHAHYWVSALAALELKEQLSLPFICTFHTLDRVKSAASELDARPDAGSARAESEARAIREGDRILASGPTEQRHLVELYDADPGRVSILTPGVDRAFLAPGDRGQARRAVGLPADVPVLLLAGRIQPLKGTSLAVETLIEMNRKGETSARLVLLGGPSGPAGQQELRRARKLAASLPGRVDFLPAVGQELLSSYYRAADLCLVPSRSESFGLVGLEASACGIPVVAARVGGLPEVVHSGVNGWLVDGRDPAVWADTCLSALRDPERARLMGEQGARLASRYSWAGAARRFSIVADEILGARLVGCG
jgi:D-inositol-3-phosphate glycosyltransferase